MSTHNVFQTILERADPFKNRSCIPKEYQKSDNIYTKMFGTRYTVQVNQAV